MVDSQKNNNNNNNFLQSTLNWQGNGNILKPDKPKIKLSPLENKVLQKLYLNYNLNTNQILSKFEGFSPESVKRACRNLERKKLIASVQGLGKTRRLKLMEITNKGVELCEK